MAHQTTSLYDQLIIIKELLMRDFFIFKKVYLHKMRIALSRIALLIFVAKMFLPSMGLQNYAPFILMSSAIGYGFFIAAFNAIDLVDDITDNQAILYELTLPVAQWMIFAKYAISTALQALVISLSIIPCGLLVIGSVQPFAQFSLIKFISIFICASLFYGSFMLIFTSCIRTMLQVENIWLRLIFPMWYLGCFQFPWQTLYKISPTLAYLDLLNPMTFIMEGMRSATLGTTQFLPFWLCCSMILCYATISFLLGISWMKKRLDCL
jgi:ABC-type polysaccharide/polyol phosphate export permease